MIRIFFTVAVVVAVLFSQNNFPMTHLSSYLLLPSSADGEASGGAFVSSCTNPASSMGEDGIKISASYRYRWGDASDDFLSVDGCYEKYAFFAQAEMSSVSEIEGRTFATSEPDYIFYANRANIMVGVSRNFGKNIRLGLAYRHIYERIEFTTMDANTFSAGLTARWQNLYGGISITDYGSKDSFLEYLYPLPTTYRTYAEYFWKYFTLGATFVKPDMLDPYGAVALKISPVDWFDATISYSIMHDTRTFSGGTSFYWNDFSIKYSFALYGDVGTNHFVSVGYWIPLASGRRN